MLYRANYHVTVQHTFASEEISRVKRSGDFATDRSGLICGLVKTFTLRRLNVFCVFAEALRRQHGRAILGYQNRVDADAFKQIRNERRGPLSRAFCYQEGLQ